MKRILKSTIYTLIAAFGLMGSVNAATLVIGNDTTTAGATNKSVSVELKDADLGEYSKVEFQLVVTGTTYAEVDFSFKASALSFKRDTTLGTYIIGAEGEKLFETTIGSISYKTTENLNSDFKITATQVKFHKTDGTVMELGSPGIKVQEGTIKYEKPKSSEALLTSLTASQGTMTPEFSSSVNDYTIVVKDTIPQIRLSGNSSVGSTKTGLGLVKLEMGENNVEIVVTAEDGTTKNSYNVKIIRGEIAEPSAYLKKLEVNNIGVELSPEFDSKNNKYTITVGEDISELKFKYEAEDPLAVVEIEGNENFEVGENLVKIKVKSSNGEDEQTYEITVVKEEKEETPPVDDEKKEEKEEKPKKKTWLIVLIAVVIVLIVGGVTFLLFRKKKKGPKDKGPKNTLKEETSSNEQVREAESNTDSNDFGLEEESITDVLKTELYEDDRTQKFDDDALEELKRRYGQNESELDKTKEFNFKDFE